MEAYKLSFKFNRDSYEENVRIRDDEKIKLALQQILDEKSIIVDRIYAPNRNSIKAVFYSEGELNKVLDDNIYFMEEGCDP